MKKKIIAKVIKYPRSTINQGRLGFDNFPVGTPKIQVLEHAEIAERLDNEIDRYVQYIYKNNYGFKKTERDHYGRKHIPKTVLKLEQLLYIKYGTKIEVEI